MRRLLATLLLVLLPAACGTLTPVAAEWKPEYADQPPEVRAWYSRQVINEAARIRLNVAWRGCCDHADVVKTRFSVNKTTNGDEWSYLDADGVTWKKIPDDIIHWGDSAPGGQPTLFVYQGKETCFFPPGENNL